MRISDFDVLIAPRPGEADEGDWPNRWLAKLSTAKRVAPRDIRSTERAAWTDAVADAARAATRPVLFVGHGLGATAVASAAFQLGAADVRGAFLVTPPDRTGLGRIAAPPWPLPSAPLPWPSLVIGSRNAADGAFDAVAALATEWGAEFVDAGEAGGLDAASGHGPWPEGLMRLAAFIKKLP
jgi:predicted alpha/beta hydrolase family esterase